ncbi:hypothetical protein FHG87_004650 [Trinorchestia longiramus]|nr:hypothetical protein FHG87_004650 [Trinorchestia longiramus]
MNEPWIKEDGRKIDEISVMNGSDSVLEFGCINVRGWNVGKLVTLLKNLRREDWIVFFALNCLGDDPQESFLEKVSVPSESSRSVKRKTSIVRMCGGETVYDNLLQEVNVRPGCRVQQQLFGGGLSRCLWREVPLRASLPLCAKLAGACAK